MLKASLVLEDGTVYEGTSFGAEISVPGEVGKSWLLHFFYFFIFFLRMVYLSSIHKTSGGFPVFIVMFILKTLRWTTNNISP